MFGDKEFKDIVIKNGVQYFDRTPLNATSSAKSDEVVLEAIEKTDSKNIFWINITHPFTKQHYKKHSIFLIRIMEI